MSSKVPAIQRPSQKYLRRKVRGILVEGESVLAISPQTDISRLWITPPNGLVVTSHRLIFANCGWFTFDFQDFEWRQVQDVHVSTSLMGATFTAEVFRSKTHSAQQAASGGTRKVSLSMLDKSKTMEVYKQAQAQEHQEREAHRHRIMEEKRAGRSIGLLATASAEKQRTLDGGGSHTASSPHSNDSTNDLEARLQKLKSLHDKRLLSDAEYQARRNDILDQV